MTTKTKAIIQGSIIGAVIGTAVATIPTSNASGIVALGLLLVLIVILVSTAKRTQQAN